MTTTQTDVTPTVAFAGVLSLERRTDLLDAISLEAFAMTAAGMPATVARWVQWGTARRGDDLLAFLGTAYAFPAILAGGATQRPLRHFTAAQIEALAPPETWSVEHLLRLLPEHQRAAYAEQAERLAPLLRLNEAEAYVVGWRTLGVWRATEAAARAVSGMCPLPRELEPRMFERPAGTPPELQTLDVAGDRLVVR